MVLLTQDQLEIVPLANLSEISTELQSLEFQLSKLRLGTEYVSDFRRYSAEVDPLPS